MTEMTRHLPKVKMSKNKTHEQVSGVCLKVLDFSNKRQAMKNKFGGEFFPSNAPNAPMQTFLDFFQVEKFTGQAKGILLIVLTADPALLGRA